MKIILALLTFFMISPAFSMIKVAVIDTGFDFDSEWVGVEKEKTFDGKSLRKPKLCKDGHKDFTDTGIKDSHGHGTHVSGIIGTYAGDSDYCLVIVKYYSDYSGKKNLENTIKAIDYAVALGVDVINYSGGGLEFSLPEYNVIKRALDNGIVVVTAAGNERAVVNKVLHSVKKENSKLLLKYVDVLTLDFSFKSINGYYPANYDKRIFSVVNLLQDGVTISPTSNRGAAFTHKAVGEKVKSLLPNNKVGKLTGTSQATPKITAKIINGLQSVNLRRQNVRRAN